MSRGLARSIHLEVEGKKEICILPLYQKPTTNFPLGDVVVVAAAVAFSHLAMHERAPFLSSVIIIGNIWQRFNTQLEVMFHDLSGRPVVIIHMALNGPVALFFLLLFPIQPSAIITWNESD